MSLSSSQPSRPGVIGCAVDLLRKGPVAGRGRSAARQTWQWSKGLGTRLRAENLPSRSLEVRASHNRTRRRRLRTPLFAHVYYYHPSQLDIGFRGLGFTILCCGSGSGASATGSRKKASVISWRRGLGAYQL